MNPVYVLRISSRQKFLLRRYGYLCVGTKTAWIFPAEMPRVLLVGGFPPFLMHAGFSMETPCYDHWKVSSIAAVGKKAFGISVPPVILRYSEDPFQNSPLKTL